VKRLLTAAAGLAALVVGVFLAARLGAGRVDFYYLDVLNTSGEDVTVSVSGAALQYHVAAISARTFVVNRQSPDDRDRVRQFVIRPQTGDASRARTIRSRVDYGRHVVLDVTGDNCIVAADYGPQYRPKDMKLPAGMRDISVVKVFRHESVFLPVAVDARRGVADFTVAVGLGEKLPDRIEVPSRSSRNIQELVRLVPVPCTIVDNERALYDYLQDH
jgi:hypothetical protein